MNDLNIESLDYFSDMTLIYQTLSQLPGFSLLESSHQVQGRYDIVTAWPYEECKIERDCPFLSEKLALLEKKLMVTKTGCDLPFQGGAIGYFSYDMGAKCAGLIRASHPANEMPLVDLKFYDWAIVCDHQRKKTHLVFGSHESTARVLKRILPLLKAPPLFNLSFKLLSNLKSLMDQKKYQAAFNNIHTALTRGRCYQVNFTQPFMAHYEGNPWAIYQKIKASNPMPFSAYLSRKEGDVLSFSPERFLLMDNECIKTSPIKGTLKRSATPILDEQLRNQLANSEKNRAENVMIVDLLRNDLSKIAKPGQVKVTRLCGIESYPQVHHLVSDIVAAPKDDISRLQAFRACFPGGSITGAPKLEAMRVIYENEEYARGIYCGSIGYFSRHGRVDSNIVIRTLIAKKNTLYLGVGGAIVLDSEWEDEYHECYTKISAIMNALSTE